MLPALEASPLLLELVAVAAYLLGSVPFGVVIARALGLGDLRAIGSGNIGATNVLRTGHRGAALATLLLDAGKGGAAVLLARAAVGEDAAQVAAFFSFLGHLYPVWLGFRGGKGVATFLGTLLALAWPAGLLACATWAAVAAVTRLSSLSALVAAAATPVWLMIVGRDEAVVLCLLLAALVFQRHRENIVRMRNGKEPRIGTRRD